MGLDNDILNAASLGVYERNEGAKPSSPKTWLPARQSELELLRRQVESLQREGKALRVKVEDTSEVEALRRQVESLQREGKALREKMEAAEKAVRENEQKVESVYQVLKEMLGIPAPPQRSTDEPTPSSDTTSRKSKVFDTYRDEPYRAPNLPGRVDRTPTQIPGPPQFPKNWEEKEAAERDREFLKDIGRSLMDPGANWGD